MYMMIIEALGRVRGWFFPASSFLLAVRPPVAVIPEIISKHCSIFYPVAFLGDVVLGRIGWHATPYGLIYTTRAGRFATVWGCKLTLGAYVTSIHVGVVEAPDR